MKYTEEETALILHLLQLRRSELETYLHNPPPDNPTRTAMDVFQEWNICASALRTTVINNSGLSGTIARHHTITRLWDKVFSTADQVAKEKQ